MGRDLTEDLTKQYASLFEQRRAARLLSFFRDVYRSGKLREIVSFAVWEVFHRLGLFRRSEYLAFSKQGAISLGNERLNSSEFQKRIADHFQSEGLSAARCDHDWKLIYTNRNGDMFGCLYPDDFNLYRSADGGKSIGLVASFPDRIKSIFVSSRDTLFVCVSGSVHRAAGRGTSFTKVLELGTPISFFRFNNAMTETPDGTLVIGEYGNLYGPDGWKKLAYLYYSSDDGETWKRSEFLIRKGANKHVHVVKFSPLLQRLMVADGDNHKRLWLSEPAENLDLENLARRPVNRFHIQMGGYTSVVECGGKVLFGTDYQGGTNFIVESADGARFSRKIVPDPYRRSPIDNMLVRASKRGDEVWANLPYSMAGTKCLLMYTQDNGASWNRAIEYDRSAHTVWLISSSSEAREELYFSIADSIHKDRVVYRIADLG